MSRGAERLDVGRRARGPLDLLSAHRDRDHVLLDDVAQANTGIEASGYDINGGENERG